MLVLTESQIKEIISKFVTKYLQEISVKGATKKMGYQSPKIDPFKKKKLFVNMHAPGLMGEWRGDRRIPFEEPEFANKANYEHFIDFLENIGKYGSINGSGNADDLYERALEEGFKYLKENHPMFENDFEIFYEYFRPENHPELWKDGTESFNVTDSDLTYEGITAWNDFLWNLYQDRVDVRYQLNERNLVHIYRAISIPNLTGINYVNLNMNKEKGWHDEEDYYQQLNRQFFGVGMSWSYEESGAIPYGGGKGTTVTIYGLISPDDIDWVETCALNGNGMDEREIRIKTNVPIEIYQIVVDETNKKLPLRKPIIVPSGEH